MLGMHCNDALYKLSFTLLYIRISFLSFCLFWLVRSEICLSVPVPYITIVWYMMHCEHAAV